MKLLNIFRLMELRVNQDCCTYTPTFDFSNNNARYNSYLIDGFRDYLEPKLLVHERRNIA